MTRRLRALLLLALAGFAGPAAAWTPDGPVRLVVGASPGGPTDVLGRILAESARGRLPQPVVVENLSGASGNLAAAAVTRARPDGRTILLGYGALVLNRLRGDPPGAVDPLRDLTPVAQVATAPVFILVRAASGIDRIETLGARLRADAAPLLWGPSVPGTIVHLAADQLIARLGGRAELVPYRGSAALLPDFLAGRLTFISDNPTVHLPALGDGTTRALTVLAQGRSTLLPEVPSLAELGHPDIDGTSWFGLLMPAGAPPAAVAAVAALAEGLFATPGTTERLAVLGLEPAPAGPDAFRAMIAGQMAGWAPMVRAVARHD